MIVLTVNAGRSSIRWAAFDCDGGRLVPCGSEHHEAGSRSRAELLCSFTEGWTGGKLCRSRRTVLSRASDHPLTG
jgi:hypothetical protein